jgi:hypothetical protein
MEPPGAIRNAVLGCIKTRDNPSIEERDKALAEVALLLEDIVRDRLDDTELAASLDGLNARHVTSDVERTLNISGAFWTLGMKQGRTGDRMLPMDAHLSVEPGTVSVVRVANRQGLVEMPESERQFQRAFEKAVWQHSFELRLS